MTEPQLTSDRDWTRLTFWSSLISGAPPRRPLPEWFRAHLRRGPVLGLVARSRLRLLHQAGLIAWLIRGTTEICGNGVACVRTPAPLLHAAAAWFVFLAARRLYDYRIGFWSALAYVSMPAVSLSSLILKHRRALAVLLVRRPARNGPVCRTGLALPRPLSCRRRRHRPQRQIRDDLPAGLAAGLCPGGGRPAPIAAERRHLGGAPRWPRRPSCPT